MDARLYNLRRAEQERRKAALALTEEARRIHIEMAEIFEARIGLHPAAIDGSNVVQLRPKAAPEGAEPDVAAEELPGAAEPKRKPGRARSTGRAPRAG